MANFTCNFISYTMRRAITVNVIIPSITSTEGEVATATHKPRWKYPVLYLLHGYWNDCNSWQSYTSIERYAEERRIAVVTFSAENNMYMRLSDVKSPTPDELLMEPDYEKLVTKEIPEFVTNMFPISKKPSDTYIAGLSMGGFGALCNGFRYPSKYRAVGAFSPLPSLRREDYRTNDTVPAKIKKYEPLELIKKAMKRPDMPDLYYSYGEEDFLFDMQEWFREKLEAVGVKHTLEVLPEYGHEWAFWDMQVEKFLDWIPRTDPYYLEQPKRRI